MNSVGPLASFDPGFFYHQKQNSKANEYYFCTLSYRYHLRSMIIPVIEMDWAYCPTMYSSRTAKRVSDLRNQCPKQIGTNDKCHKRKGLDLRFGDLEKGQRHLAKARDPKSRVAVKHVSPGRLKPQRIDLTSSFVESRFTAGRDGFELAISEIPI